MSSKRRRSSRPDPARYRLGSNLEALESRQLLTQSPYLGVNDYPLTAYPQLVHTVLHQNSNSSWLSDLGS